MTKEEITICKMYLEEMGKDKDCNEYKLLMQMLELQPSDDCVSRKAMLNAITEIDDNVNMDIYTNEVREIIEALPPVTPTHGTCKNCSNYVKGALDEEICLKGHELIHKDFFCADFEKRGE